MISPLVSPVVTGTTTGGLYQRVQDIGPTIKELQAAGATSLRAIAAGLNDAGIPTARGDGSWSAVKVARVLERIP